MSRPSDARERFDDDAAAVVNPRLGPLGWVRWGWRQLTSMRTALLLLLALAVAAVPGSLIPQESADPNGVDLFRHDNPVAAKVVDALQGFTVYSSVWFSAIYLLLFLSLIGCVIPRVRHHVAAVRAAPPRTPSRFDRLPARSAAVVTATPADAVDAAERLLKARRYRTVRYGDSVSAERGYLRETGNLLFHTALLGVLVAVFVGSGFTWTAQKTVPVGETFVNGASSFDSSSFGRFVDPERLPLFTLRLDRLSVRYQTDLAKPGPGQALDYRVAVTTKEGLTAPLERRAFKLNEPLSIGGSSVFLLGNGYAPHVIVRNPDGSTALNTSQPFQPQDAALTSLGAIKVRNTTGPQIGLQGFFYPTCCGVTSDGARTSLVPSLGDPVLSLNVYKGRFGTAPENAFQLDTSPSRMTQVAGRGTAVPGITLSRKNPTATLPDGLGTIELAGIDRYAALDIHHDPSQGWVALFVGLAVLGLMTSLLVPRRRMWVKVTEEGEGRLRVEYAGLARGDDPGLARAVADLQRDHGLALPVAEARQPVGV